MGLFTFLSAIFFGKLFVVQFLFLVFRQLLRWVLLLCHAGNLLLPLNHLVLIQKLLLIHEIELLLDLEVMDCRLVMSVRNIWPWLMQLVGVDILAHAVLHHVIDRDIRLIRYLHRVVASLTHSVVLHLVSSHVRVMEFVIHWKLLGPKVMLVH